MDPETLKTEAQQLLTMMGIHIKEISVIIDNDLHITVVAIRVSGTEEELFTENNNSLSRDFGHIFKETLKKKHHFYKDIVIDINGKNKQFIDMAKQKASIAVERVQFFDNPYEFGYLNSYERMLIHSYLKNIDNIITESQGEGHDRRLVVKKKTSK
jgi:predicted RNA-binding protein Jag